MSKIRLRPNWKQKLIPSLFPSANDSADGKTRPGDSSRSSSPAERFSRLEQPVQSVQPPAPPRVWYDPDPDELGSPQVWLYVSRRLDLDWLPNVPLWSGQAVRFGATVFYRLSARTLVWLEKAGEGLEKQCLAGQVASSELDAYLTAMEVVWAFAAEHLNEQAVRAARQKAPALPEVVGPMM